MIHEGVRYKLYVIKVRSVIDFFWGLLVFRNLLDVVRLLFLSKMEPQNPSWSENVSSQCNHQLEKLRWVVHGSPIVGKAQFPTNVCIFSVMFSENDCMWLYFFWKNETIDREIYLSVVLKIVMCLQMDDASKGKPYVFQQKSSAHTNRSEYFSSKSDHALN